MKVTDICGDGTEKETFSYTEVTEGLNKYEKDKGNNQKWVSIIEIVVNTQQDKDQLLKAFEYIHNLRDIDSDFLAVNTLIHMYETPEKIKIKPS